MFLLTTLCLLVVLILGIIIWAGFSADQPTSKSSAEDAIMKRLKQKGAITGENDN